MHAAAEPDHGAGHERLPGLPVPTSQRGAVHFHALIRSLVASNPSPAYIQRVTTVFNNNGSGVRGDLRAVVTAILTDAEARNDTAQPNSGRLKDPIYHIVSFVRALNGLITPANGLPWLFSRMGRRR